MADRPRSGREARLTTVFARLFLLFMIIALVELYFLIKIGSDPGALNTILLLPATAFFGALMDQALSA